MFAGEWDVLDAPNNKVVSRNGVLMGGGDLPSPTALDGLALWLDAIDQNSLLASNGNVIQDGEAVALWSDKSGNSAENCLVLNGVSGNYGSFTALTAFGSGDFSVSLKINTASIAIGQKTIGANVNGFNLIINTSGFLLANKQSVADVPTASTTAVSVFQDTTVGYVRSSGIGTYYVNGVSAGTTVDVNDYTVGCNQIGSSVSGTSGLFNGRITSARVYNAALDASAMAADAAGAQQANCVFDVDFRNSAKLATSATDSVGSKTVTINSTGATGARISGARDPYQGTVANRPVWLKHNGENFAYFAGVAGYTVSVPLANDTYDVEITYKDGTTDTSTIVVGAGVAAFGGTDAKFAGLMVKKIAVTLSSVLQAEFDASYYTSGTTFVSSDTLTWTLNGGAHIVTRTGLYFDGVNDYIKSAPFSLSQPESVYFIGEQVSWVSADGIFDGASNNSMSLNQASTSPNVRLYSGGADDGTLLEFPLKSTGSLYCAFHSSGGIRLNRGALAADATGTTNGGGFTLGAKGTPERYANIFVSEVLIYAAAHDTATQGRLALYAGRKWKFAV